MDFDYKQVIIVRKDLSLGKGKLAVQVAHASLQAYKKAIKETSKAWEEEGAKKVVLQVENKDDLIHYFEEAKRMGFSTALIKDAGLTEVPPGTITALGIGPDESKKIDKLTRNLPLLS